MLIICFLGKKQCLNIDIEDHLRGSLRVIVRGVTSPKLDERLLLYDQALVTSSSRMSACSRVIRKTTRDLSSYIEDDEQHDKYFCNVIRDLGFAELRCILIAMD